MEFRRIKRSRAPGRVATPNSFNPLTQNAAEMSTKIEFYVLETAAARARYSNPENFIPQLAWRVSANEDFTEFVIYLRRGVKWHLPGGVDLAEERYAWLRESRELTAHDMVFSFELNRNPQVESGAKSGFEQLDTIEALDDYTVRATWKKSEYMNLLVMLGTSVLPEFLWAYDEAGRRFPDETLGVRFNQHWYGSRGTVGTGPYRMVSYQPGSGSSWSATRTTGVPGRRSSGWSIRSTPIPIARC